MKNIAGHNHLQVVGVIICVIIMVIVVLICANRVALVVEREKISLQIINVNL